MMNKEIMIIGMLFVLFVLFSGCFGSDSKLMEAKRVYQEFIWLVVPNSYNDIVVINESSDYIYVTHIENITIDGFSSRYWRIVKDVDGVLLGFEVYIPKEG